MTRSRSFAAHVAPFIAALLIVIGDRISKIQIQQRLCGFQAVPVIPGWLRIVHTENPGAAFGMLAEGNPALRSIILIGVSAVVLIFVGAALLNRGHALASLVTRFGLGLIFGGALGNLYDRVVSGTVTDFIEVYHGAWAFPAFNVADSSITVGAILLLFDLILPKRGALPQDAAPVHK